MTPTSAETSRIDVSIVMPCLDEAQCLPVCIAAAREALAVLHAEDGLTGEVVIADNGSTDGSQLVARAHGARVVDVAARGYGAALIGGFRGASGRFLVMGDADGSYDFREAVGLVRRLVAGADLCMGNRFAGGIAPGAMPWKNRWIGNPVLTGILNLFFRSGIGDAHCGLRALTRDCFERLALTGSGMEFASEMVIKAALKHERIAEEPVTLAPDLRDRAPHLRPWRDGWRHLRYLVMLSPAWAFAVPAAVLALLSLSIWAAAALATLTDTRAQSPFGNHWVILAGALLGLAHVSGLLAASTHLYGCRQGYRRPARWERRFAAVVSLETMLIAGAVTAAAGLAVLVGVLGHWSQHDYAAIPNVLPAVIGTTLLVVGGQTILGGFLLAVVTGNEARFLDRRDAAVATAPSTPAAVPTDRAAA